MKLKNVLYAGALMSVALLASCSLNDSDGIQLNGKGVQFSAKINGQQSVTRVSTDGTSWSDGDKIGIFASTQGTNSEDLATNVQYTTDKDGNLTAAGEPVQYKDATTLTDFKAYYPYSASVANKQVAVNVANQGDQAAIDYLYASVTGKKSNDGSVALPFDHKLVKLVFNMNSTSDLSGLSIKLQGTQPAATLNIADGTVAGTGSAADVTLKTAADGKTSEGIVIPTQNLANVKLVFSKAGKKDQTTAFPSTITSLAGGTKYTIGVKIGETSQGGITVTFGGATISPWTDQKGDIQIPDFEDGGTTPTPAEGDGTVDKPFTVAQAQAKQDDSQAWVTGYVVGYVNGASLKDGAVFELGKATVSASNLLLAASADVKDPAACIPVQLVNGSDVRAALNLKDNASVLGKQVKIYGQLTKYFSVAGLKSPSAAYLDGKLIGKDPSETPAPTPGATPGTLTKAAELTEGTYAIGYNDNGTFRLLTHNKFVSTYYGAKTDWTSGDVPAECQFKLTKSGNNWLIQGNDGKYVCMVKSGTHTNLKFNGDNSAAWALTDAEGGVKGLYGTVTDWLVYSTKYNNYTNGYAAATNVALPSFYKIK